LLSYVSSKTTCNGGNFSLERIAGKAGNVGVDCEWKSEDFRPLLYVTVVIGVAGDFNNVCVDTPGWPVVRNPASPSL